jgi:hypothetical protein
MTKSELTDSNFASWEFPTQSQLPKGWKLGASWGIAQRLVRGVGDASILMSEPIRGRLKFMVHPKGVWRKTQSRWPDCPYCKGGGSEKCENAWCVRGRVQPLYGASPNLLNLPNFPPLLQARVSESGLMNPTVQETLQVMTWCDELLDILKNLPLNERYP